MKKLLSFAVTAIALLAMASCGGSKSSGNSNKNVVGQYDGVFYIVFNADGTATVDGQACTYKVDGSKIIIDEGDQKETLTIKGDDLLFEGTVIASRVKAAAAPCCDEEEDDACCEDEEEEEEDLVCCEEEDEDEFDADDEDEYEEEDVEEEEEEEEVEAVSSADVDAFLDKYESVVNKYIKIYKKAMAGDMNAYTEMTPLLGEMEELSEQAEEVGEAMNAKQATRLQKILEKLANAMQ